MTECQSHNFDLWGESRITCREGNCIKILGGRGIFDNLANLEGEIYAYPSIYTQTFSLM